MPPPARPSRGTRGPFGVYERTMYTLSGSPDAVLPALAVADFGGVAINFSGVTTGDAVLIGPEGTISGASAVARFLSRCSGTSAAGRGGFEAAKVSAGTASWRELPCLDGPARQTSHALRRSSWCTPLSCACSSTRGCPLPLSTS